MTTCSRLCRPSTQGARIGCNLPSKLFRARLICFAEARSDVTAVVAPAPRTRNGSMIRSLAHAVELTGQVQRYETFAGRSAMVGVAAAACIELITDRGVFFPVNTDTALAYAAVATATLVAAVAVALARGRSEDATSSVGSLDILESVYASLTAVRRSAASVTQAQVDKAVDYLLETVLDRHRLDFCNIDTLLIDSSDDQDP